MRLTYSKTIDPFSKPSGNSIILTNLVECKASSSLIEFSKQGFVPL
jgi:hypothetical protein